MSEPIVFVATCRKFEQVWNPFFTLFKKFWPDCPYKVVMSTDTGSYPGIKTISTGKDLGWVGNLIHGLQAIDADRVIFFIEDFLPNAPFNTDRIKNLIQHSIDHNIGCLRLQPCPGPTAPWPHDESLGILQPNDPYRLSTQTAIWDKSFLLSLLVPTESPWETEIKGTKRASKSTRHFVSVKRGESPTPYIITGVVKGVWQDSALDFLKQEGIPMDKITKVIR